MELKKCFNCGNEVPMEANFCPKCMTKLTEEEEFKSTKRKRNRRILVMVGIIVFAIVLFVCAFLFFNRFKEIKNEKKMKEAQERYEKYLGTWANDSFYTGHFDNIEHLEIVSAKGNEIVFNVTKRIRKKKDYIVCALEYQKVTLMDGYGQFKYEDEATLESGIGEITLKNKKVYLTIYVSKKTDVDNFDITMDTGFSHQESLKKGEVFHLEEMIGDFNSVRYNFLNREKKKDYKPELVYYYANGGLIAHLPDRVNVTGIEVDYNKMKSDYNYLYRGIDAKTTKSDFKRIVKDRKMKIVEEYEDGYMVYDSTYHINVVVGFKNNKVTTLYIEHKLSSSK